MMNCRLRAGAGLGNVLYRDGIHVTELYKGQDTVIHGIGTSGFRYIPKEQLNFNEPGKCVWDLGGNITVFIAGSNCTIDGTNMEIGCYNNPSEGNYIFRS